MPKLLEHIRTYVGVAFLRAAPTVFLRSEDVDLVQDDLAVPSPVRPVPLENVEAFRQAIHPLQASVSIEGRQFLLPNEPSLQVVQLDRAGLGAFSVDAQLSLAGIRKDRPGKFTCLNPNCDCSLWTFAYPQTIISPWATSCVCVWLCD